MEIPEISGLVYVPNYLSVEEAERLWETVIALPWLTGENQLKNRRVQHYGWEYNYRSRSVTREMDLGELPEWARKLAEKLHRDGHTPVVADQVIVNEYEPGTGISAHVDCEPCFTDTICSISLGSPCVMELDQPPDKEKVPILLDPNSLLVLRGEARYNWRHRIPNRIKDPIDGKWVSRTQRISLTFRSVILED